MPNQIDKTAKALQLATRALVWREPAAASGAAEGETDGALPRFLAASATFADAVAHQLPFSHDSAVAQCRRTIVSLVWQLLWGSLPPPPLAPFVRAVVTHVHGPYVVLALSHFVVRYELVWRQMRGANLSCIRLDEPKLLAGMGAHRPSTVRDDATVLGRTLTLACMVRASHFFASVKAELVEAELLACVLQCAEFLSEDAQPPWERLPARASVHVLEVVWRHSCAKERVQAARRWFARAFACGGSTWHIAHAVVPYACASTCPPAAVTRWAIAHDVADFDALWRWFVAMPLFPFFEDSEDSEDRHHELVKLLLASGSDPCRLTFEDAVDIHVADLAVTQKVLTTLRLLARRGYQFVGPWCNGVFIDTRPWRRRAAACIHWATLSPRRW